MNEAAQIGGMNEFENRYGRARCLKYLEYLAISLRAQSYSLKDMTMRLR